MVCNDSRIVELLKQFTPTADEPGRYRPVSFKGIQPRKDSLEYQLLQNALLQTSWRDLIQKHPDTWALQGIYMITPSGKVLAGSNHPMNVDVNLSSMRKALDAYVKMPREERLLARAPDRKKDRMYPDRTRLQPPANGLILRVVGRGLDDNLHEHCHLRPTYHLLDRLWLTREEAMEFLPVRLDKGEKKKVTGPVLNGLALIYLTAHGPNYEKGDAKDLRLTSEVIDVAGTSVKLKLTGRAALEAQNKWFPNRYYPDLLGYVGYDTEKKAFTRFELLAYGRHNLPARDRIPGNPEFIPVGFLFTLNPSHVNDDQVPSRIGVYAHFKLKAGR